MVFFSKMMGDYYGYIMEFVEGQELEDISDLAKINYEWAKTDLTSKPICNPIKLGMIVSKCVFQYEVLKEQDEAISLGNKAYEIAMKELDEKEDGADM
jgi:hypothetical protein